MNIITKTLIGSAVAAGTVASAVLGVAVANAATPSDGKAGSSQVQTGTDKAPISTSNGSGTESTGAIPADELPAGSAIDGVDLGTHDGLSVSGAEGTSAGDLAEAQPATK